MPSETDNIDSLVGRYFAHDLHIQAIRICLARPTIIGVQFDIDS